MWKRICLWKHDYGFLWFISLSLKCMLRLNAETTLNVNQLSLKRTNSLRKWDFWCLNSFNRLFAFSGIIPLQLRVCLWYIYMEYRENFTVEKGLILIRFDEFRNFETNPWIYWFWNSYFHSFTSLAYRLPKNQNRCEMPFNVGFLTVGICLMGKNSKCFFCSVKKIIWKFADGRNKLLFSWNDSF